MSASDKVIAYEIQIESMLRALQERIDELEGADLDTFDRGRRQAYTEMMDIIKTRHIMIYEVINDG